MEEKKETGKAERLFQNLGQRIDRFMEEVKEAKGKLGEEYKAKFEELRQSADRLKKEAENKERWKEVESSLKKAGEELEAAFRAAFKKRDQQGS
jgi:predicted RNase H-like nuclease (RuvC/YqgF family)